MRDLARLRPLLFAGTLLALLRTPTLAVADQPDQAGPVSPPVLDMGAAILRAEAPIRLPGGGGIGNDGQ